jgi:hypothetical protein
MGHLNPCAGLHSRPITRTRLKDQMRKNAIDDV